VSVLLRRVAFTVLALGVFLPGVVRAQPKAGSDWAKTLERVAPAVVTLRISMPRSFDDQEAGYQTATGFVVDAERGLILTNRHVVTPGPVVAEAIFLDNEEVPVRVVYRDPVHDFGLFSFDPKALRFMPLVALPLSPERARVGTEIRVLGNDAGEKLSILAGTLARLDRQAPPYGRSSYNDFNTFYFQAASGTSGGSSGAPVIDIEGRVLALNAGANRDAASSFFLPLDRVVRALERVRRREPVPRGTLQVVFEHRPYDELRRLGLRDETEARVREHFPNGDGLLVVDEVIPGGPAGDALEPGDVLLRVAGEWLDAFVPLEQRLDDRVGTTLELELERGGQPLRVELSVSDLHALTPSALLEAGGGVLNPLSYQMARNYALPVRGVFLAQSGYAMRRAGVPTRAVITELAENPIDSLDDFERTWAALPHGRRVPVRYFNLQNPRLDRVAVVEIDRKWFPLRRCDADPPEGWSCRDGAEPPEAAPAPARTARIPSVRGKPLRALAPSLVSVSFDIPYPVDGVHGLQFRGAGLIVDRERGWVVVDRETVPISLGDIQITFAASVRVPGELVYLHPEHNLALLRYDPAAIGTTPVESAQLDAEPLAVGDDVWLVGLSAREQLLSRETEVARIEPLELPLLRTPRFRETNLEVISLADTIPTIGGVLADGRGRVRALWASFSTGSGKNTETFVRGIPIERVAELVEPLRERGSVGWRSLGVEWRALSLSEASDRGLSDSLAAAFSRAGGARPQVLSVEGLEAGSPAARLLREGDLLLRVEGQLIQRFAGVERAAQRERVRLELLRGGEPYEVEVDTRELTGEGTERAILWAGAVLQSTPRAIALQRGLEREGVYVSFYFYGSPANRYGLRPTRRIFAVNGVPTPDLDAFLAAIQGQADSDAVRLQVVDLEGRRSALTLKVDLRYWPTGVVERGDSGWRRVSSSNWERALAAEPRATPFVRSSLRR